MALEPGTQLGPYEITGWLGAGGMGEVYRARDTKLGREVAIKTLPAALAGDTHRLARFEREAQLLAALNHPHIAAVYALAEHDGAHYLAMELVEGKTLAEQLARGAPPLDDALRWALQIAEALEAAHGKSVVHRDLKPANVMVTKDGQIKVLDFGLAKAFVGEPGEASPAHSPASLAMTQQGFVLGTAGYMSPEQASGQVSDQRADIWAFGVVLYEMLTGSPLFQGESVPHVLADVLKTEPDWTRLPKNLHPRLKSLLERCLTKKPRSRLHSIADARIELEAVLAHPEVEAVEHAGGARRSTSALWFAALAATAAVAAIATWYLKPVQTPAPEPIVRFSQQLPDPIDIRLASMLALSRDGTRIAYDGGNDTGGFYLRDLHEGEARPIPGTAEALGVLEPAFSPDGQWLAYVQASAPRGPFTLKRIPVSGGAPVSVYAAPTVGDFPRGLSWPEQDTLLFANDAGIVRVPANGGAPEVLVTRQENEGLLSPQLLPGANAVLFTRVDRVDAPGRGGFLGFEERAQIVVASLGQNDRKIVWQGGSAARYLPTGHLVYAQGARLFAIAFDLEARAVRGGPVVMVEDLARAIGGVSDAANYAVSDTGTLARIPRFAAADGQRFETTLTWVDRDGREEPLPLRADDYTAARIAPDGTRVALTIGSSLARPTSGVAIWIYDLRTENLSLLAADPPANDGTVWSANGERILFRGVLRDDAGAVTGVDVRAIDLDSGEITLLAEYSADYPVVLPWALTPDGQTLAVIHPVGLLDFNIATLSLATRAYTMLLAGPGHQNQPSFSRDWVAYVEGASPAGDAVGEINIRPYPAVSRTRIPVGRGDHPVFSRDGTELFFFDGQGISVAAVSYEPTLRVGAPRRLFQSDQYLWSLSGRAWDPDPTGQRFLMIRNPVPQLAPPAGAAEPEEEADPPRVDVVLNWFQELESRVPIAER